MNHMQMFIIRRTGLQDFHLRIDVCLSLCYTRLHQALRSSQQKVACLSSKQFLAVFSILSASMLPSSLLFLVFVHEYNK
jgi:hypothetical protein